MNGMRAIGTNGATVETEDRLARLLKIARRHRRTGAVLPEGLPRPPTGVRRASFAKLVSHLHHGERAAGVLCRRLRPFLPEGPARIFLDLQIEDEERHAALYGAYLETLALPLAPDVIFAPLLERIAAEPVTAETLLVANHLVLEDDAVDLQAFLAARVPCPVFTALNREIRREEARHVAFGRLLVRSRLALLPQGERRRLFVWSQGLRATFAHRVLGEMPLARVFVASFGKPLDRLLMPGARDLARRLAVDLPGGRETP